MGSCLSKSVKVDIATAEYKHKQLTPTSAGTMENEESLENDGNKTALDKLGVSEIEGIGAGDRQEKGDNPGDIPDRAEGQDATSEKGSEKEVLTPELIEEKAEKALQGVKDKTSEISPSWSIVSEDGHFPVQTRNLIIRVYASYFALKGAPLERIVVFRKTIKDVILETKAVDIVCEVFKHYTTHGWKSEVDGVRKTDNTKWTPYVNSAVLLMNFSDLSEELAVYICNYPGFLESIKHILVTRKEAHVNDKQKENARKITSTAVSLSHNTSMYDQNVGRLKELDFTPAIEPYLQSPADMTKLNALATLASIVDEKESEIINANPSSVKLLLKCIEKGSDTLLRRHCGWSVRESLYTLRMLARNDANKKMLYELGAGELLVKVGQTGNEEEKYECVQAIWTLAFDREIRKSMVEKEELGLVELLQDIKNTCEQPPIKKACNGALWTMREELKESKNVKYQQIGKDVDVTQPKKKKVASEKKKELVEKEAESGHIMISYQWANQTTLIQIRDVLKEHGLKVWMDIDQMAGSTLQSMADAVEKADIVLMAMSQKYKDSPNCRAEAEYAFTKHKKIIPLLMERGYRADGWLGFILGAKLFFEFSGKYAFDTKMNDLLKQINVFKHNMGAKGVEEVLQPAVASTVHRHPPDTVDYPQSHHPVARQPIVAMTTINTIREWKSSDVHNWINKNDLKSCGLSNLTGGEVALLITMRQEAPEFFYKCLQSMLHIENLLNMSKIVWALTDLVQQR